MAYLWHARVDDKLLVRMAEKSGRKAELIGLNGCPNFSWHERHGEQPAQLILGSFGDRQSGADHAVLIECLTLDRITGCDLLFREANEVASESVYAEAIAVKAGINFGRPSTHLYVSTGGGLQQFRWKTQEDDNDYHVERHLLALNNDAEVLATYKIEKNGYIFHQLVITFHKDLDPLLTHVALASAAHHVTREGQYYKSSKHSTDFEHPNPRNAN